MKVSVLHLLFGTALSLVLVTAAEVQAQNKGPFLGPNTNAEGEFTAPTPKQAKMLKAAEESTGDAACRKYLEEEKLNLGLNFQGTSDEIHVTIGAKPTRMKLGAHGFIDSRYIAFREALLEAKQQMAKTLEQKISSEAMSSLTPQKDQLYDRKTPERRAADLGAKAETIDTSIKHDYTLDKTINKGMRWLNAMMDSDLKEQGHDPQAEKKARQATDNAKKRKLLAQARKAEAAAEKIVQSSKFKEVIRAMARLRMKGIYTLATNETVTPERATVCVVAAYTRNSEKLADAMARRDFSGVPQVNPDKRVRDQLLDRRIGGYKGKLALASAWGLDIMFDENGHINLVAYGQAGVSNPPNRIRRDKAMGRAQLTAENLIRLFINSAVALDEAAKTAENLDELVDQTTKVELSADYEKVLEEKATFLPINGITPVHSWSFIHPATSQEIRGSVVRWNASMAAAAMCSKQRQGSNYKRKACPAAEKQRPLRRGRTSTTKKSKRF